MRKPPIGDIPVPEGCTSKSEFGRLVGWGSGDEEAIARARSITALEVEAIGMTTLIAAAWRDAYVRALDDYEANPSARGRIVLMQRIIELCRD